MTFNKNNYLKRNSTISTGSGLTPEQEALLIEVQGHLDEFDAGTNQWEPMMIGHEIVTTIDGNLVIGKGT